MRNTKTIELSELRMADWIKPGQRVSWGQACAEPQALTRLMVEQRHEIAHGGRFSAYLGVGSTETITPAHADCIDFMSYCGTGANRALARAGVLDILPAHYSLIASMMADRRLSIDVLLLQVAPSGTPGRYALSIANEYLVSALASSPVVIAMCNQQAPVCPGAHQLGEADIDVLVHVSEAPVQAAGALAGPVERAIAERVASLIDDGDTLQFGLGAVPDTVLAQLSSRRHLGIHSGLIGDRVVDLSECGALTNARKSIDTGVSVCGSLMGTSRLFAHADGNPAIRLADTRYTHHPDVLARIDRFVAINSAIEVDLSGQINAEVARGEYVGAVGGSIDFLRGAARSRGGRPIVALPSTAGARSRIVASLSGPVSTPRSDAGFIITEHGVADLRGATLSQRRERLLAIADPAHRASLDEAFGRAG